MKGTRPQRVLMGTCLFILLQVGILFGRLLPLSVGHIDWPGPDIALCLAFTWMIRRPDQVPALVIAAVFLLEDIMLLRPVGLWAAIALIACEYIRLREMRWRDQPFVVEWLRISALLGAMVLGYRVVQYVFLLEPPALGMVLLQYIATITFYPVVVLAARWLIGLRRISPIEAEMLRHNR